MSPSAAASEPNWKQGPGGFGTASTPNSVVNTEWKTSDIWIRRSFELKDDQLSDLVLSVFHDEDAEIYINGQLAAKLKGYTTGYITVPVSQKALKALKPGPNTIAIHCNQTDGGQFIDAGIKQIVEK